MSKTMRRERWKVLLFASPIYGEEMRIKFHEKYKKRVTNDDIKCYNYIQNTTKLYKIN